MGGIHHSRPQFSFEDKLESTYITRKEARMPRRARITMAGVPHHIIQRGNNRSACFYSDGDYLFYLDWLEQYAKKHQCSIHAYVLMTNHVHLLITPETDDGLASLMKSLGQRYVQYVNRTYSRSGTLWEGRFRSCITNEERYVLACYRYIELNPIRANIVEHPAMYKWSSYRVNAQDDTSDLIEPHGVYLHLARTQMQRKQAYRELFRYQLEDNIIDEIRSSTNGNYALGTERFRVEIEAALGRRASIGIPGRPRKERVL